MAGFRELAREHVKLSGAHDRLAADYVETRKAVAQVIGHHNFFVKMPLVARLRWLLLGVPAEKPVPVPQPEKAADAPRA